MSDDRRLYFDNAFGVLSLSPKASYRDVRRRSKELILTADLANSSPVELNRIRSASVLLEDPVSRLLEELFWPLLVPDYLPADFDLGSDSQILEAIQTLNPIATAGSEDAWHDLAILQHVWAIRHPKSAFDNWRSAIRCWRYVWENSQFWTQMTIRATELDDPRANEDLIAELRDKLPGQVFAPSAHEVSALIDAGSITAAIQHLTMLRESGFAADVIEGMCDRSVSPLAFRIETLLALTRSDMNGAAPDPTTRTTSVARARTRLINIVLPRIEDLRSVAPRNAAIGQMVNDAAQLLRNVSIGMHNDVHDTDGAIEILLIVKRLAVDDALMQRISADLQNLRCQAAFKRALAIAESHEWNAAIAAAQESLTLATDEDQRAAATSLISQCRTAKTRKRDQSIKRAVGVAFFVGILLLKVASATGTSSPTATPTSAPIIVTNSPDLRIQSPPTTSAPPARATASPTTDTSNAILQKRLEGLKQELDGRKLLLDSQATDLDSMDAQISQMDAQLTTTRNAWASQGAPPSVVNAYNDLLATRNVTVSTYNSALASYKTSEDSYNAKVAEYNALLRNLNGGQ